ncbi:regulatory protein, luxR family [Burkholderia sp. OK233]|nr:regulatory protein, luxR family [Burkholderia sp. OK233]
MQLSTAELSLLLDLVGVLHEPSPQCFVERPEIVRKMSELLHVDIIGHTVWSSLGERLEQNARWGRDEHMDVDYKEQFQALDPISPLLRGRPDPMVIESLVDRKTLQRTQYFADFLSAYKVYPGVSMYLQDVRGMLFDYRFGTSDAGKRFGRREVSLLNVLRPHLINAQRLRLVARSQREASGSRASCPAFTLDASKELRPNRKARALLASLEQRERDTLYRLLSLVLQGSSTALQWNGFNLCVGHISGERSDQPTYAVHLVAHTIGSGAWLQQRFELTLREGEVCHLMLKGAADKEIAILLNISYWTVRIHVSRVLDKLGVDSRSAIGLAVIRASHKT